jgi:hypothetical protein
MNLQAQKNYLLIDLSRFALLVDNVGRNVHKDNFSDVAINQLFFLDYIIYSSSLKYGFTTALYKAPLHLQKGLQ